MTDKICGISIVRGGVSLELALRKVIKGIPIGKILIHSKIGTPMLHYYKFPKDLSNFYAILVDDQIATGAAALMAIRVVLDHQVPEDKILYISLIASPLGLSNITNAFPKVRVITASIEEYTIEDGQFIKGGFGNFADRYFGTLE